MKTLRFNINVYKKLEGVQRVHERGAIKTNAMNKVTLKPWIIQSLGMNPKTMGYAVISLIIEIAQDQIEIANILFLKWTTRAHIVNILNITIQEVKDMEYNSDKLGRMK